MRVQVLLLSLFVPGDSQYFVLNDLSRSVQNNVPAPSMGSDGLSTANSSAHGLSAGTPPEVVLGESNDDAVRHPEDPITANGEGVIVYPDHDVEQGNPLAVRSAHAHGSTVSLVSRPDASECVPGLNRRTGLMQLLSQSGMHAMVMTEFGTRRLQCFSLANGHAAAPPIVAM